MLAVSYSDTSVWNQFVDYKQDLCNNVYATLIVKTIVAFLEALEG